MTRFVVARRLAHAGGISTINNRLAAKTLFLEPTPLLPSTYTPPTSPLARLLQRTRLPMGWGAWHLIKSLEPVCQGTLSGLPAAFGAVMWRLKGYVLSSYTALMEAYTKYHHPSPNHPSQSSQSSSHVVRTERRCLNSPVNPLTNPSMPNSNHCVDPPSVPTTPSPMPPASFSPVRLNRLVRRGKSYVFSHECGEMKSLT